MDNKTHTTVAVITGASRGLGRSTALHLAARGVGIIGTYRSHGDEAAEVASLIEAQGVAAAMLPLDTGQSETFGTFADRLATALRETFARDRFDILVNNAGVGTYGAFAETTEAQFDELVRVQFKGPFFLSQRLLPLIADGGQILNISSGLTRFTFPGRAAYAATKGAIEVLTRFQALELAPRGIRVNVLAPGATATDFGGGSLRDNPEVGESVRANVALGRIGQPDDIGAAAAAFLSEGFGWVTGERLEVSGGQHL